jgi:2-dehydropantoate 2-reductase
MAWRALVLEALDVYRACGIKPKRPYVPFLPFVLALPDWAYNPVASALFPLDPRCKSSMLQDCETGRATEIDALCGEIVRLARRNANRARDEDAGAGGEGGDDARGMVRGIGRALAALGFGYGFGFGRGSRRRGRTAPLNARAIELVRRLERMGLPDGRMGPDELWEALTR